MSNGEQISEGSMPGKPAQPARGRPFGVTLGYVVAALMGVAFTVTAITSLISPGPNPIASGGGGSAQSSGMSAAQSSGMSATRSSGMSAMMMAMAPPTVPKLPANSQCTQKACPIASPATDELSVAGQLGGTMATAWLTTEGEHVQARVELLNLDLGPVVEPTHFAGDPQRKACGPGCWVLTLPSSQRLLTISARDDGHLRTVSLPLQWRRGSSALARKLVNEATTTMRGLVGVKLEEQTATGTPGVPGDYDDIHFVLSAPDSMSATVSGYPDKQVTIGNTQWTYSSPAVGWISGSYNGGTGTFKTTSMFTWPQDEQSAQVLSETNGRDPVAVIALMNPHVPAWLRLTVQEHTGLVTHATIVTDGTFTNDHFSAYGAVQHIVPPQHQG
jgi:hypothetical protein